MLGQLMVVELKKMRSFFNSSTKVLTEEDSGFKPEDEMYTVAQHVAHAAHTVEWFSNNAFTTGPYWDDNVMKEHQTKVMPYTSLNKAREWLNDAFDRAEEIFGKRSDEELLDRLPADSLMGPVPRMICLFAIQEHTAHHRGALAVYARLLGKTPQIPYMPDA